VSTYYEFADEDIDLSLISEWVLRIKLIKKKMLSLSLKLRDIKMKIKEAFSDNSVLVVINHDNAEDLILRVRIIKVHEKEPPTECWIMKKLEDVLLN